MPPTEAKTLTRRELYDLAWSKPITKLAADFGLSDVGLAKICDRFRVPTPPRGYWARLEAGRKVERAHFREVSDPDLNRIEIRAGLSRLPEAAREVIERAKAERKVSAPRPRKPLPVVVEPVENIHKSLERMAKTLRRAKPDANGSVHAVGDGLGCVIVGSNSVERVVAFLDALTRQLEAKGPPLTLTKEGMRVSVGPDSAVFTVKERIRRERHVPTDEELAAEERRQRKLQRRWSSSNPWDTPSVPYGRVYPEYDFIQTGELALQIEGYNDGIRRKWADGRRQRLELLVDQIVVGIEALLAARKARREENERKEREWAEISRRRHLKEQRAQREKNRGTYVDSIVKLHREANWLRAWLSEAEPTAGSLPNSDFSRLIAWAKGKLADLDATITAEHIDQDLKSKNLFPETDDLHDPLGEPPEEPRWRWEL